MAGDESARAEVLPGATPAAKLVGELPLVLGEEDVSASAAPSATTAAAAATEATPGAFSSSASAAPSATAATEAPTEVPTEAPPGAASCLPASSLQPASASLRLAARPPSAPTAAAAAAGRAPASAAEGAASLEGAAASLLCALAPIRPAPATTYSQFLERLRQPLAQAVVAEVKLFVSHFPAELSRPQGARRIHGFLSDVTPHLLATGAFVDLPAEEVQEVALEGLEKFVVLKLHKLLFRHAPSDLREDERIAEKLREAAPLALPPPLCESEEWRARFSLAAAELQQLDRYRAPRDKAICIVNAHRYLETIVAEAVIRGRAAQADAKAAAQAATDAEVALAAEGSCGDEDGELLRCALVALLVEAAPPNLYSNLEFTAAFRHPSVASAEEERRCLRHLLDALTVLVSPRPSSTTSLPLVVARRSTSFSEAMAAAAAAAEAAGGAAPEEVLPLWLKDAGVGFHFEPRSPEDLLVGEVDELLDEYHRMLRALRELSQEPEPSDRGAVLGDRVRPERSERSYG